ncbi:hypothetical protein SAMN04489807_0701 [Microbacterium hydrocarbonoxydans]|uniref:Uncharacterized protein n=2 Tax=Microbacterium hydrocarbonoxydans TaxID=273678 RepID=A0A1H4JCQ6_9MICO|nr:hypothetical protein SAMN04489807_0701 [Microbacterium hydrocarbonoxydans]
MVDDAHSNGSEPDAVIPPPPAAPPGDLASSVPLAPPLSGPPAPPAPHAPHPPAAGRPFGPPAPPLPPYASAPQAGQYPPQYPAGQYPAGQYPPQYPAGQPSQFPAQPGQYPVGQQPSAPYGSEYPYPAAPPTRPSRSGRTVGIVVAAVAAFVLLVVVGIGVAVSLLLGSSSDPVSAPPLPSVTAAPTAPSDEPSAEEPPSDDPGDADASGIADVLQSKIDEYKQLRDSGALWEKIPDNEFNRTAVSAFLYFLVDMKSATLWGVDEAQAQEYQERMTMLEERLLAQQPLGDDIKITLEDKVFTYDGETGEGGYVEE